MIVRSSNVGGMSSVREARRVMWVSSGMPSMAGAAAWSKSLHTPQGRCAKVVFFQGWLWRPLV
jgi:hypothetical protein